MPVVTLKAGKCTFCAFELAEWLAPSIGSAHGRRFFSQKSAALASKRKAGYKDGRVVSEPQDGESYMILTGDY